MKYLAAQLQKDLNLKNGAIQEISGGMSDAEQQAIVENLILVGTFSNKGDNLMEYQQLSLFPSEQDEIIDKIKDLFPGVSIISYFGTVCIVTL